MFICIFSVLLYRYIYEKYIHTYVYTFGTLAAGTEMTPDCTNGLEIVCMTYIYIFVFSHSLSCAICVLQCVAVYCSVLQCVEVCCSVFPHILCLVSYVYFCMEIYIHTRAHLLCSLQAQIAKSLTTVWVTYIHIGWFTLSVLLYICFTYSLCCYIYIYTCIYIYIHIYICVHICCARFRLSEPVS